MENSKTTANELCRLRNTQSFKPVTIHLADKRKIKVHRADYIATPPKSRHGQRPSDQWVVSHCP